MREHRDQRQGQRKEAASGVKVPFSNAPRLSKGLDHAVDARRRAWKRTRRVRKPMELSDDFAGTGRLRGHAIYRGTRGSRAAGTGKNDAWRARERKGEWASKTREARQASKHARQHWCFTEVW